MAYEWQTSPASDKRMIYEWHTSTYDWHTNGIQVAYGWFENDIRNIKMYKGFGAARSNFKIVCDRIIALGGCKHFLVTMLFRSPYFLEVLLQGLVTWIIWQEAYTVPISHVQC